jgi:NAD(P)-dependent dehydrogenase (short-subunit alcohol dehydrogenase family)
MRVVAITGVSRGLGQALLDGLLGLDGRADLDGQPGLDGARVVAIGRRFTERQRALANDRAAGRLTLLTADLSDPGSLPTPETFAAVLDGCTDAALVHNAAVVGPIGPVGTLPAAGLTEAVTVNLIAPVLLTNAFLAAVPTTASRVRIVFVSSGAAQRPVEGWLAYCAGKRGGEAFFDVVAAEAARVDRRVSVAAVNPGVMDTGMQAALREAGFPDRDRYVDLHRRGELPQPREAARKLIAEHLTDG